MRQPHLDGYDDPVTTMVMNAGPADVETVIVSGEVMKHGGHLVGPHAEHARELIEQSRTRLRGRAAA
jgi:5-methylthioadenosine/S-adenosylhomocysteine deaminase